jgi:2-oxoglutarate dehydrogenase E2 component (dihydrolipoamide succinyltransferase)
MPQLGESIAEGTIVRWLKKVGDTVQRDEPLLEISTDKVDAEIPSTAAGVLLAILAQEGDTVTVNSVIAQLGEAGETAAPAAPAVAAAPPPPAAPVAPPPVAAPPAPAGAATSVVMPQLGESIAEGTIVRWLKKVGDTVQRDEPLLEISTDKVDAEIPSTVAGTLLAIHAQEGETIAVNAVIATIGEAGAAAPTAPAPTPAPAAPAAPTSPPVAPPAPPAMAAAAAVGSIEELRRVKSSPVVRKIAAEHGVNIAQIAGSGISGRVTKKDILNFIENKPALPAVAPVTAPVVAPPPLVAPPPVAPPPVASPAPAKPAAPVFAAGERVKIEPMTKMRKSIADHMILSKRTSAHVTTFFEVDFTNIARLRDKVKKDFEARNGAKLTFMPFITKAAIDALKTLPVVNASVDGDNIVYKQDINIGIAVALDWGLIVPVIKQADAMNLIGLARATQDLAFRARNKQLKPDEVSGGTFSITNFGLFGGLTATPVINQPQVAILGVGGIHKRPWVMETEHGDVIAIRHIGILSLSFDHRIIDGAVGDEFLATMKKTLETTDFSGLL